MLREAVQTVNAFNMTDDGLKTKAYDLSGQLGYTLRRANQRHVAPRRWSPRAPTKAISACG